jgi:hypothetical protein
MDFFCRDFHLSAINLHHQSCWNYLQGHYLHYYCESPGRVWVIYVVIIMLCSQTRTHYLSFLYRFYNCLLFPICFRVLVLTDLVGDEYGCVLNFNSHATLFKYFSTVQILTFLRHWANLVLHLF